MKRWRKKPAKPGELKVYYGLAEDRDGPDVCYGWGPGVRRCDGSLLYYHFGTDRLEFDYKNGLGYKFGPSFLKELEDRGYDLTTIKFSIQKKAATSQTTPETPPQSR